MSKHDEQHPFITLRARIREATRQYRHKDDNSASLFHPDKGFVYSYDLLEVEEALSAYEQTLPTEFIDTESHLSKEDQLIQMGSRIVASVDDPGVREFAQEAVAYLIGAQMEAKGQIMDLVQEEIGVVTPFPLSELEDLDPSVSEGS